MIVVVVVVAVVVVVIVIVVVVVRGCMLTLQRAGSGVRLALRGVCSRKMGLSYRARLRQIGFSPLEILTSVFGGVGGSWGVQRSQERHIPDHPR